MSRHIGRGLGPGPVFMYEWIISARRWQPYAVRSLFVLGLLAAATVVAIGRGAIGSADRWRSANWPRSARGSS